MHQNYLLLYKHAWKLSYLLLFLQNWSDGEGTLFTAFIIGLIFYLGRDQESCSHRLEWGRKICNGIIHEISGMYTQYE